MAIKNILLPNISSAAFLAAGKTEDANRKNGNILFVCRDEQEMEDFILAFKTFAPEDERTFAIIGEDKYSISAGLYEFLSSKKPIVAAALYSACAKPLPGRKDFSQKIITIKIAQSMTRGDLLFKLENCGYERADFTEKSGQYAVRGSVVDIFSPNYDAPCRVYFSGNMISTVSLFDIETQNTKENLGEYVVSPLVFEENASTLANWAKDFEIFLYNPSEQAAEIMPGAQTAFYNLPTEDFEDCGLKQNPSFNADFKLFDAEAARQIKEGYQLKLYCLNMGELQRLQEVFADYESLKRIPLLIAPLREGFYSPKEKFAFYTSTQVLNRTYRGSSLIKKFDSNQAKHVRFKELETGDYIVHQEHGIGRYQGMKTLMNDGLPVDCLIIEYKRGEKLYIPVSDFRKIQKYIGLKGKAPRISSLSGNAWREVKKRVKEDAQKTAKEILRLEALRQSNKAQELFGDDRLEREFADSFPYEQTPDQTKAIEEILTDLTQSRPMDRVLIGDVGFGKTEVAMRAALRAALSGTQVLVLVPTTVLAAQHYKTVTQRMAAFPVSIELLCRFQTKKEQKDIVSKIKKGITDIAIGTHRLLSKDVDFKNLGLCIIDEEHRFGVKQKEKIKAKSLGVHTLMLSATPIPRTLNQSLSSLREMSIIQTPPPGRMTIKTRVLPYGDDIVSTAIRDEIARGGQVFYLYNKVETMQEKLAYLQKLLPEVKFCAAHGQLDERTLENTLWDFYNKRYDVLLASTIIESGLDVTNANTLIIENAQDFGLAQLYQLRGRIGRSSSKAYCYLLHPAWLLKKKEEEIEYSVDSFFGKIAKKKKDVNEEARKRLSAIMEFSELGSGFKLALRDLEIRGGGELLGVRQHGYVNEVGLSLYCDLVANEVKKLKGVPVVRTLYATTNLKVSAYIPPDYLPSDNERLRYYKELMASDYEGKKLLLAKLENMAGKAPAELLNLIEVMQLSMDAGKINIRHIEGGEGFTEFYFTRNFKIPESSITKLLESFRQNIMFLPAPNGDGIRIYHRPGNILTEAKRLMGILQILINPQEQI
ncbi:MAG: DEAD/DEAH box helicase [Elusimicrobiaceae bacterium]